MIDWRCIDVLEVHVPLLIASGARELILSDLAGEISKKGHDE